MEQTGIFESNSKIVFDELIEKYEEKYEEITNYLKGSKADKSEVEKKADKSEVAALKSKVHTLESQVEKLLKSNEELSKSNDLRVSQLQSTLIAPQEIGSTTHPMMETVEITKPKIPPEETCVCKSTTGGVTFNQHWEGDGSVFSESYLEVNYGCSSQNQKNSDMCIARAQGVILYSLNNLYSLSLIDIKNTPDLNELSYNIPDNKNNLFKLYEKIYAELTSSSSNLWKNTEWEKWNFAPESRKKFIDLIISQVIINTFFELLSSSKSDDTNSLKSEIATINGSGLLYQKAKKNLDGSLKKITYYVQIYKTGYTEYVELANENLEFLEGYKKTLYVDTEKHPIDAIAFLRNRTSIIIKRSNRDKIKKIISGGKSVSNSNPANGRSRY